MPKALADAKKADRKQVERRIGKPPRHVPSKQETPADEGVDTATDPVVQCTGSIFNPATQETIMSQVESKEVPKDPAAAQAAKEAAVKAKIAEKEAKLTAAAEAKAKREKEKAEKLEAASAKKAERDAKIAARKEEQVQRADAIKAAGRQYTGSMLALADRAASYVKAPNGQLCSGDHLAMTLGRFKAADVITLALHLLGLDANPHVTLNIGQQSMNLRNKLRAKFKAGELTAAQIDEAVAKFGFEDVNATKAAAKAEREAKQAAAKAEREAKQAAAKAEREAKAQAVAAA